MAQRWILPEYGGIDALELVESDTPAPGSGEVTIEVRSVGVNPSDFKTLGGGWNPDPSKLPLAVGQEASGVITEIGPDVDGLAVGDEVIAFKIHGGFATELNVAATDVFAKPPTLDFPAAANLLHVGVVAAELLHLVDAAAGDTILVHGASGSVGVSVLQQAALLGVTVVGTASEKSFDRVRRFGARPIAYGDGLEDRATAAAPSGFDAAIDAAGTNEALETSIALIGDRSRIASLAPGKPAQEAGVGISAGMRPDSIAFRMPARARIIELAAQGSLTVPVARTFRFTEAKEALRHVATGHPGGKVALVTTGADGHDAP